MRELRQRAGPILKIACLILAVLLMYQLAGIFIRWNPFRHVTVPELPSLTADTNSPAGNGPGTNRMTSTTGNVTNNSSFSAGTKTAPSTIGVNKNPISLSSLAANGINSIAGTNLALTPTNIVTNVSSNSEMKLSGTNLIAVTNLTGSATNLLVSTNSGGTNIALIPKPESKKQQYDIAATNSRGEFQSIPTTGKTQQQSLAGCSDAD